MSKWLTKMLAGVVVLLLAVVMLPGVPVHAGEALAITTTSLPEGVISAGYTAGVAATGGTAPYTFSIATGSLPNGLSMDETGAITGTPTVFGTSNFTVKVTDDTNASAVAALSIRVRAVPPQITTTSLPTATWNSSYSAQIDASGTAPISFSVTAGALPAGLSLSGSTIAGTPTVHGSFNFTVTATGPDGDTGTKNFTLTVNAVAPVITTASLPGGTVGAAYSATVQASGTETITFALNSGSLPAGLTLYAGGSITGTPTAAGEYTFEVIATGPGGTGNKSLTIKIAGIKPAITTTSLPGASVGKSYSVAITATGTAPIAYSIVQGSLPQGLTLQPGGGITGTPVAAGTSTFTVKAKNSGGEDTRQFTLVVDAPPVFSTNSLPDGIIGAAYSTAVTASGTTQISYRLESGSLPDGLALSAAGMITGTPVKAGKFTFTVAATGAGGSAQKQYSIQVKGIAPTLITTTLPGGKVGSAYTAVLSATGTPAITYAVVGKLPDGLSLSADGKITGTPTKMGQFPFTVVARSDFGSSNRDYTIAVTDKTDAPGLTGATLTPGVVDRVYSAQIAVTGTAPITLTVTSGSLPAGLRLNEDGRIHGTPTKEGESSFEVTATNDAGSTTARYKISIKPAGTAAAQPDILTANFPAATVGTPYNIALAASGDKPILFTVTEGTLPGGLTLSADGVLAGTPSADAGSHTFTITATNDAGSVSATFTIEVKPAAASSLPDTSSAASSGVAAGSSSQQTSTPAGSSGGGTILIVGIAAVAVIGLVVLAVILLLRRRRDPDPADDGEAGDDDETPEDNPDEEEDYEGDAPGDGNDENPYRYGY